MLTTKPRDPMAVQPYCCIKAPPRTGERVRDSWKSIVPIPTIVPGRKREKLGEINDDIGLIRGYF